MNRERRVEGEELRACRGNVYLLQTTMQAMAEALRRIVDLDQQPYHRVGGGTGVEHHDGPYATIARDALNAKSPSPAQNEGVGS